ncbi:MAG: FAD-dependent oxidoreductase [candidate division WOR-3 bacterium]
MTYDVVVIGGGIAGLWTALNIKRLKVLVVAPKGEDLANTYWAQGGIAAALDVQDSPTLHYEDTLKVGRGLNDKRAVAVLTHYAPVVMNMLINMGFRFNPTPHLEAGHTVPRVWNVGDETGKKLLEFLTEKTKHLDRFYGKALSIKAENGRIIGVQLSNGEFVECQRVVLATGGYAALWKRTTNPKGTTGEGILMGAKIGAYISDMEFVQFHPTVALTDPPILLTEALRGAGAKVVDESGKEIANPLLPRDELSRIIYDFRKRHGDVFLDISKVPLERFPIAKKVREIFGDKIPISPAAHYSIGGLRTDTWGRTNINGLWAVGECSNTGVHGANRLASNSLIEGLVLGYRVALDVENDISTWPKFEFLKTLEVEYIEADYDIDKIRDIMEGFVSVSRDREGLEKALEGLKGMGGLGNLAKIITLAALWREESRGVHYRKDFPTERDEFRGRLGIRVI